MQPGEVMLSIIIFAVIGFDIVYIKLQTCLTINIQIDIFVW